MLLTLKFHLYHLMLLSARSLRPFSGKKFSIIIDHADNIKTHGLPDLDINWSLDRYPSVKKTNLIDCRYCGFLVKAWADKCPECGRLLRSGKGISPRDVRYVDAHLVELHRTRVAQDARDNMLAINFDANEIKDLRTTSGRAAETVNKIALWFFNNIKNKATISECEYFMSRYNNIDFWASHFKLTELNHQNEGKCLRVLYDAINNK